MTVESFFAGQEEARQLFEAVRQAVEAAGPAELRVRKSQIAFRSQQVFAIVWMPSLVLRRKAAPLVLPLALRSRSPSPRWKEIVEPAPGRFTHHLELYSVTDIDDAVRGWILEAWQAAS